MERIEKGFGLTVITLMIIIDMIVIYRVINLKKDITNISQIITKTNEKGTRYYEKDNTCIKVGK